VERLEDLCFPEWSNCTRPVQRSVGNIEVEARDKEGGEAASVFLRRVVHVLQRMPQTELDTLHKLGLRVEYFRKSWTLVSYATLNGKRGTAVRMPLVSAPCEEGTCLHAQRLAYLNTAAALSFAALWKRGMPLGLGSSPIPHVHQDHSACVEAWSKALGWGLERLAAALPRQYVPEPLHLALCQNPCTQYLRALDIEKYLEASKRVVQSLATLPDFPASQWLEPVHMRVWPRQGVHSWARETGWPLLPRDGRHSRVA
jgi:hypothetical protein